MTTLEALALVPLALVLVACGAPAYQCIDGPGAIPGLACLLFGWVRDRQAPLALVAWYANPCLFVSYAFAGWIAGLFATLGLGLSLAALRVRRLMRDTSGARNTYRPALGLWLWLAAMVFRVAWLAVAG